MVGEGTREMSMLRRAGGGRGGLEPPTPARARRRALDHLFARCGARMLPLTSELPPAARTSEHRLCRVRQGTLTEPDHCVTMLFGCQPTHNCRACGYLQPKHSGFKSTTANIPKNVPGGHNGKRKYTAYAGNHGHGRDGTSTRPVWVRVYYRRHFEEPALAYPRRQR